MRTDFHQNLMAYKEVSWENLLRTDLGSHSLEPAQKDLDTIKRLFDFIINYQNTSGLAEDHVVKVQQSLTYFLNLVRKLLQFNDLSQRQILLKEIKKQALVSWNDLGPIVEYIKFISSPEKEKDEELKITPYLEQIEKASSAASKIMNKVEDYEKAAQAAENWIATQGKAISVSLQKKSDLFNNKANDDNNNWTVYIWLITGFLSILASVLFIMYFIGESGTDLTIGASLMRVAVLVVISYFSFFCFQQFSNHKRLYEIYKFKAISLETMEELVKSYSDSTNRDLILNKAISIIFSEPSFREDEKYNQKVVDSMIDIIKKKI